MNTQTSALRRWAAGLAWVAGSTIGWTLVAIVLEGQNLYTYRQVAAALPVYLLVGAAAGAATGLGQALAWRWLGWPVRRWLWASTAGYALALPAGPFLGVLIASLRGPFLPWSEPGSVSYWPFASLVYAGFLAGLCQWPALRPILHQPTRSTRLLWILGVWLGIGLGLFGGGLLATHMTEAFGSTATTEPFAALWGAGWGLTIGVVTAAVVWVLRRAAESPGSPRPRFASPGSLLSLLAIGLMLAAATIVLPWPPSAVPESGQLRLGNTVVSFQVGVDGGDYTVAYDYAAGTPAQVHAVQSGLLQTAAGWAAQGRSFKATLILAQPLAPDAFEAFAQQTGLAVSASTGRTGQSEMRLPSERTLAHINGLVLVGDGAALDPQTLNAAMADPTLIRIVSTDVVLTPTAFKRLASDMRIASMDILQQALLDQVQHDYPGAATDRIFVQQSGLYAQMARTGLVAGISNPTQVPDLSGGH